MPSAMENDGAPPGMSEAHLLAPWYAAGTLHDAERRELEELAGQDPEFAALLADMQREARDTVHLNEMLGNPPNAVWERLTRSMEEEQRPSRLPLSNFGGSLKETLIRFLGQITNAQWQAVAAFAVALCVVQACAILYLSRPGETGKFSAASGPVIGGKDTSAFIVSFQDAARIGEINTALGEAEAVIVDGPNAEGLYHVALRNDTVQARDQAYAKLRSLPAVKLILREK